MTRLVSFLGTGRYTATHYTADGARAALTPYVACAAAQLYSAQEVIVLATDKAWETHGQGLEAALSEQGLPAPERRTLAPGGSTSDYWQHFSVLQEVLGGSGDSELVLDVTHAFRAQPIFAVTALNYLRAMGARDLKCSIVYGAFDPARPETSPIWDITAAVELMDWTYGLTLLMETGRATQVAAATERIGRLLRKEWAIGGREGPAPNLTMLAGALREFGDDLSTVRTQALITGSGKSKASALKLRDAIEDSRAQVEASLPPLAPVLDRLERMVAPLPSPTLEGARGQTSLAALAQLYVDLERYLEAMTTIREARINRYAEGNAVTCGGGHDKEARRAAEQRWSEHDKEMRSLAEVRNDLNHGGYNADPKPAASLKARVAAYAQAEVARSTFLNLSNHPSSTWGEEQLTAARELAHNIVDMPFPQVDPEASLALIRALSERTLAEVPEGVSAAMVMGEHTLVPLLVRGLQERGIHCVCTTSRRISEELEGGERRVRFKFVRFRAYPQM